MKDKKLLKDKQVISNVPQAKVEELSEIKKRVKELGFTEIKLTEDVRR